MNSKRLMAMAVVGMMIASGFFMLIPSPAKAITTQVTLVPEPTNPNRVADQYWENIYVMEQNDFKVGNSYISWFRGNDGLPADGFIGYATSTNGVTWTPYAGNPILGDDWAFPYVVQYNSGYYMFVKNVSATNGNYYLFNLTSSHTTPSIMNAGNPVFYHNYTGSSSAWDYQIFNPGVAIVNGTWHMLIEGLSATGGFHIGYSYSTFAALNWTTHRSSTQIFPSGGIVQHGNPMLTYVPERNALLTLFGNETGYWTVRAAYAYLWSNLSSTSSWHYVSDSVFVISHASFSVCDPSILAPFNSNYGVMIAYSWNQTSIAQSYYRGTLLQFFDHLVTGHEELPTQLDNLKTLVIVMVALVVVLPIVGLAAQVKNKGLSKEDLIGAVIAVVVGLIMLGVVITVLGS